MRLHTTLIVLFLFVMPIARADSEIERASLCGLKGVRVQIDARILSSAAKEAVFDIVTIQNDVELKLRLAGIKVLTKDELPSEPGRPYLHVLIVATGRIVLEIDCELMQDVQLIRDPRFSISAPTWARAETVSVDAKVFNQHARDGVKDLTDQFINAYLSVNPKK